METKDFIETLLQRNQQSVADATKGLTQQDMARRPTSDANSIGFILWHIVRAEDRNFQATLQKRPQVWETGQWAEKLGIKAGPNEFGFGYSEQQVAAFPVPDPSLLLEYAATVRKQTLEFVRSLTTQKLNERIQHPAFGEMSVGQLIGRVLGHVAEHTGQIGYLRGIIKGPNK
ncbi:MAG: DinB family protein [Chloroflexi bacterium]|nr:DinB family protein [Chloroflexota bacterium]